MLSSQISQTPGAPRARIGAGMAARWLAMAGDEGRETGANARLDLASYCKYESFSAVLRAMSLSSNRSSGTHAIGDRRSTPQPTGRSFADVDQRRRLHVGRDDHRRRAALLGKLV